MADIRYIVKTPQLRLGSNMELLPQGLTTSVVQSSTITSQWFLPKDATPSCNELHALNCHLEHTGKNYYIHCPLHMNLARTQSYDGWLLKKQLSSVRGASGSCVVHIGKGDNIHTVSSCINDISHDIPRGVSSKNRDALLLEVAAGQGTELGKTWQEFRQVYEGIDYTKIGICVDTQHIYASGMCSFEGHESVVKMLEGMYDIVGKNVAMIHLNDSKKPYGSRVDRHAPLGRGYIWSSSQESLRSLALLSQDMNIDLISETTDPDGDHNLIRKLLNYV